MGAYVAWHSVNFSDKHFAFPNRQKHPKLKTNERILSFFFQSHLLNDVKAQSFKEHKLKMLNKLEQYLSTTECRRRWVT